MGRRRSRWRRHTTTSRWLGGKDTADALRAQLPNINILFTTGHSDRRSLRAELGNVQFVSKPYELDELLRRVRHAIDHP